MTNLQHIVQHVRDWGSWDFTTKAGLCAYSHAVIVELHSVDPNWGHLVKSEGQNHCVDPLGRNVAVDAALYKATGQIVDFIQGAGERPAGGGNEVAWQVGPEGEYPLSSWLEPVPGGVSPPDVPPVVPGTPPTLPLETLMRFQAIDREIEALHALFQELLDQMTLVNNYIAKPLPEYIGRAPLFGGTVISKPR